MKRTPLIIIALLLAALTVLSSCTVDPANNNKGGTPMPGETAAPDPYEGIDLSVYPNPVSMKLSGNEAEFADAALLTPSDRSYDNTFTHFGFSVGSGGLPVEIVIDNSLEEEEYKLVTTKDKVTLTASGARGVYTAVSTLAFLRRGGKLAAAEISDKPAVPVRGVIEGFYGVAWTHEYRLSLLKFMGRYKLNAYIYAPKDDPKHRSQWRALYTDEELIKMKELVECAIDNNVRFIYAISPGLDISLSGRYEKDLEKLFEKCESMYAIGVRDFAILLDDITTLDAEGHAKLLNDFQNKFVKTHSGCSDLVMITPEYCDAMLTKYSNTVASLVQPEIKMMWTGSGVIPALINEKTLKKATSLYNRKMFIWWNYPVNDTMANNLFMGPCEGLGVNIDEAINGLVSNPMNQGYASMLPLLTISDFLWNPDGYEKEASLAQASTHLAPACADGLFTFADLCRASVMNKNKSTLTLINEIEAFNKGEQGSAAALKTKLEKAAADLALLREKGSSELLGEINAWLSKAQTMIDAAIEFVEYKEASDDGSRLTHAVNFLSLYKKAFKSTVIVSPDVLVPFLTDAKPGINAVLGEDASSETADSGVTTNMPTYLDYIPENAIDGNTKTYFWSAGAPSDGSVFTYDLGKTTNVTGVKVTMAASGHADDYIRKGVIEYSTDGTKYTTLAALKGATVENDTQFTARYVRIRCTAAQDNWAIISEFEVLRETNLPPEVSFDGKNSVDLSALLDKNLFSTLDARGGSLVGKTLTIDVSAASVLELYFADTGSVKVTVTGSDGSTSTPDLSLYTALDVSNATSAAIKFSGSFSLSEIVIK